MLLLCVCVCVCFFFFFSTWLFYVSSWKMNNNFQVVSLTIFGCMQSRTDGLRSSSLHHLITLFSLAWSTRRRRSQGAKSSFFSLLHHNNSVRSFLLVSFLSYSLEQTTSSYLFFFFFFLLYFDAFKQQEKCDARLDITSHPPDSDTLFILLFLVFLFSSSTVSHPLVNRCFIIFPSFRWK